MPQLLEARPVFTERWVRSLVAERRLPYHKPSGRLVFDLAEIDEWISASRHEPHTHN